VIVGSRQWEGGIIDVPVMGYDGNQNTIGYCMNNDIPKFKIYSVDSDELLEIGSNHITAYIPNSIVHVQNIQFGSIKNVIPNNFDITSVYPNPFNPTTTIEFLIPFDSKVLIDIYNIKGELVTSLINDNYNSGYHTITWDATMHNSGIYFAKMIASNSEVTQKLILIK